ncbi:hypothetical protein [uncultured Paraglaciecola sp.]|uniref:hypothetical protein n=1 Tax=uncultured Paraglaciecola sp. TaxID=1765024 RepID=UPI00261C3FEE|nr:hypothetical protein [uncultured Paraglaciecola sp.]
MKTYLAVITLLCSSAAFAALPDMSGDDWWEIQNSNGTVSICQGSGDTCSSLPPGTYIVINHSTNQRFENITIGESITVTPPPNPFYHVVRVCNAAPNGMFGGGNCPTSCEPGDFAMAVTCSARQTGEEFIKLVDSQIVPSGGNCSIDYYDTASIVTTLTCAAMN